MATEPDPERRAVAGRFAEGLRHFLEGETKVVESGELTAGHLLAADERAIRQTVLLGLPDAFDLGLATRRAAGDRAAMLESLRQVQTLVETAVLEEICLRTPVLAGDLPILFRSAFHGSRFSDGWFGLFVRDAATRLKDNADLDPDNMWHWIELGDIHVTTGASEQAERAYRHSQRIAERLAAADPGNAGWQRDLSVSYERLGNIYLQ